MHSFLSDMQIRGRFEIVCIYITALCMVFLMVLGVCPTSQHSAVTLMKRPDLSVLQILRLRPYRRLFLLCYHFCDMKCVFELCSRPPILVLTQLCSIGLCTGLPVQSGIHEDMA